MRNSILAALLIYAPVAQAQQAFDATHCYVGTATVVFASDDATIVNFDHKGLYRGNGENKLLNGFSTHCGGTTTIINKNRTTRGGCKVVDLKGDTIALVFEGSGPAGQETGIGNAVAGTGAWKGVSGGGKWQVHTPSRPLSQGAFQACLRYEGTLTVPK